MSISVILLSGGRSSRFGGVHKPGVRLGDRSVLSRILGAVLSAAPDAQVWVVGPKDGLSADEAQAVASVREEPAFSGPLAGISTAAALLPETDTTLILAGDMPLVSPDHLRALIAASRETDRVAAGIDDSGSLQILCAAWPTVLLRRRLAEIGEVRDRAVKLLLEGVEVAAVDVDPSEIVDFDTPEDFERLTARFRSGDPAGRGRQKPVPEQVLQMRDLAVDRLPGSHPITDDEVAAVLEFASHIKHSDSSLSPVLAAFLAGRVHAADRPGRPLSIAEALTRVEEVLARPRI